MTKKSEVHKFQERCFHALSQFQTIWWKTPLTSLGMASNHCHLINTVICQKIKINLNNVWDFMHGKPINDVHASKYMIQKEISTTSTLQKGEVWYS